LATQVGKKIMSDQENAASAADIQQALEAVEPAYKKVHVVINPGAGLPQPILRTINDVFYPLGVQWDVSITQKSGDGERAARQAVESGYEVVAVYGGDGTVMEVARGVKDTNVPLAIFPGGTANVMANELFIPLDLPSAARLVVERQHSIRKVDMGKALDNLFLLRLGMGVAAEMTKGADRATKGQLGNLAYMLSAMQALQNQQVAHYRITVDGQEYEADGITCFVANSGNLGRAGVGLSPSIAVSDGMLDVVVISPMNLAGLISLAANALNSYADLPQEHKHWQGKRIRVETDPPQAIEMDGEVIEPTTVEAEVIPLVLNVIVPLENDPDYIRMQQLEEQSFDAAT
jgi:diacylglycerol kinase (ATP)